MATHPEVSTSELVLTLVAIRLAAMVTACVIALAAPAHPHNSRVACSTVEAGPIQAQEDSSVIDETIRDMLRHD